MGDTSAIFPSPLPWYFLPNADEYRPMTIEAAADWLGLRDLGYENPTETLANWAAHGKIPKSKLGNKVVFNLKILRALVQKNTEGLENAKDQRSNPPTQDQTGVLGVSAPGSGETEDVVIREPCEGDEGASRVGTAASPQSSHQWGSNVKFKLNRR